MFVIRRKHFVDNHVWIDCKAFCVVSMIGKKGHCNFRKVIYPLLKFLVKLLFSKKPLLLITMFENRSYGLSVFIS